MPEIRILVGERVLPKPTVWTIRVEYSNLQRHTFALQDHDGCYMSAHTKLAGFQKLAKLSSPELAQEFINATTEIMKKRHGEDVVLIVEPWIDLTRKQKYDDAIVLARIKQNNFAPNKIPILNANQ